MDGDEVINNDGLHDMRTKTGRVMLCAKMNSKNSNRVYFSQCFYEPMVGNDFETIAY